MNRYRRWAEQALAALRDALGGHCSNCGGSEQLEFDCREPRGDRHHRFETNRRACFYRREHAAGNLQLLCRDCHEEKSKAEQYWLTQGQPF